MNYLLNFTIPQGPTGPTGNIGATGPQGVTGPTGPTGSSEGLKAYGGRYNNTSQTINLTIGAATQIPLSTTMPNSNTTYTTANSITISQSGVYEINYFSNMTADLATGVTMSVRQNGTNIPSTTITRSLSANTGAVFSGSTIVSLTSGAVIDLAITSLIAVGITLESGVNATLSVKRLN